MNDDKATLYVETSVVSYLTAWPSRDLVVAAHQQITHDWWNNHAAQYELFVSEAGYEEAKRGDPDAAARRLAILRPLAVLEITSDMRVLAEVYSRRMALQERAAADALHMAIATYHSMEYLVTWNCRHIARASVIRQLGQVNSEMGFTSPTICTPEEPL